MSDWSQPDLFRLHWWAWARWWVLAAAASGAAGIVLAWWATGMWVLSVSIGLWVGFKLGTFRVVPVGWVPFVIGAALSVLLLTGAVWVWAVWKTVLWWKTLIRYEHGHMTVNTGVVSKIETHVPARRLTQFGWFAHPFARVLGYGTMRIETAGQIEFVDRVRFCPPRLYGLVSASTRVPSTYDTVV